MEKIFYGKIEEDDDSLFLIGGESIIEELEDLDFGGKKIHLGYIISDKPINPETIEEESLRSLYGDIEADHVCIPYSEWTGFVAWDEELKVGGHDLKRELLTYENQYCYLKFWQGES